MPARTKEVSYDLSVHDTGAPTVRQPRAEDSSLPLPSGSSLSREGMDWLAGL